MPPMLDPTNTQARGLMTIGEASRRSGFTIKALRFYERRGLLPRASRRPNGYRVYDETDLGRLRFIRDAKALGLTLTAISEIVASSNGNRRRRLLNVLDHRIGEASAALTALTRLRGELKRRRRLVVRRRCAEGNNEYCGCLKTTSRTG
jgi:DNA-binding transcriptional MerR regulator